MKMDITIAVPGIPFNGNTFKGQSLGGSESAGYYMARALAALGHRVTVFCNTEPARCDDVDYLPLDMFRSYVEYTKHDVCIVQRAPELLQNHCQARFTALWCHDLATVRAEGAVKGVGWNYDKVFVLSDFHREQYKSTYGLPDEVLFQTRNGLDLEAVARGRESAKGTAENPVSRNPLSLVYSARPERGLDVLLGEIMPRILKHEPNAKLFLATYKNPVEHLAEFYSHCKDLAVKLGDRVAYLGHLSKDQLYEVYHASGVYLYPVPSKLVPNFDEISCIAVMEAQACGLPVVTSARGALPETLAPDAGVLISEEPFSEAYYDAFATAALDYMRDAETRQKASAAGVVRGATLGWDHVAKAWSVLFESSIRKNSADLATMANYFWRHSDIFAAKECLRRLPTDDVKSAYVRGRIAADFAFIEEPDGYRKQYEKIGGTHDAAVINWSPREPRYAALKQWLTARPEVTRILDYGCAHGGYAINLLKDLPALSITGMDIDLHGIEMAYGFAADAGVMDRWRGVVGDLDRLSDPSLLEMGEMYDVVMAQEVLEHVASPSALLRALEARVKDGGTMYLTVPFGPWEYTDYDRYPYRAHVHEFDIHDLHDLLDVKGREAEVSISAMPHSHEPNTDEALGWWVINYKVTPETRGKVGEIDFERKLWLQRPRQTVSAAIIAGPNSEETLHWCLRSLKHAADEVVIVDCGLSEEALRVIGTYGARVRLVPNGPDPKVHGFETPRNLAVENCTQDWVLWIDTDEKLLQPELLHKYLRPNMYQGYSIRQHHFAVDTTFNPDMPVRLFRNNGALRFFGMIHEHPESALNAGPGRTIVIADVHIPHLGYLIESGRTKRFDRNLPMLQADIARYPDRLLQKHFIMRDAILLCTYELRANGGQITEIIRERARTVIDTYRKYFLGKGHFTNVDPLAYYSQAVTLLGEGFEVAFQVNADKVSAPLNGATTARFLTTEDALIELNHRTRGAVQPFESKYF